MLTTVLLCLVSGAPAQTPAPADPESVIERFLDAYRARDVERWIGVMSPSIAFEDPTARLKADGHAQIRKMGEQLRASYRDITIEVHSMVVSGEQVATEVTISATVTRPDGTTRNISVRGASFFVVRGGRVEKWTDYFDVQTFNEQMRAKP